MEPDMDFFGGRVAKPVGLSRAISKRDVFGREILLLCIGQVGFIETRAKPLNIFRGRRAGKGPKHGNFDMV